MVGGAGAAGAMDDDDDFLAELEAMVNGSDDDLDDDTEAVVSPEPAVAHCAVPELARVNGDAASGSVASPRRANPFLDDPATTPRRAQPEAAPFVGMPSMLRRDGSTDEYPIDTKPEPSIVSSEEFVRMQNELMALRNFKYESLERAKQTPKPVDEEVKKGPEKKSTRALEKTMSFAGAFNKRLRGANKNNGDKKTHQSTEEVANLQRKINELEAEIMLHKETKDHLANELQSVNGDFDDQRVSYQTTIADLTRANSELHVAAAAAAAAAVAAVSSTTVTTPDQGAVKEGDGDDVTASAMVVRAGAAAAVPPVPVTTPPPAEAAQSLETLQKLQQEQHNAKIIEAKCTRLSEELKRQGKDVEQMRGQLRRETDKALHQASELTRAHSDAERLRIDASRERLCAEKGRASSRALAEMHTLLQQRLAECEAVLNAENERADAAEAELQRLNLLLEASDEERLSLTKRHAADTEASKEERLSLAKRHAAETEDTASLMANLMTAQTALSAELNEKNQALEDGAAELAAVQEDLTDSTLEIERLNRLNADVKLANEALQNQVDELEPQVAALSRLQAMLDAEIESRTVLQQENTMLVTASEKISATYSASGETLAIEREAAKKAAAKIEALEAALVAEEVRVKDLDAQVVVANSALEMAKAEQNRLAARDGELSSEMEAQAAAQAAVESANAKEKSSLEAAIAALELVVAAERDSAAQFKQRLADSETQRKLDQKQSSKNLKNLTRELQKHKPKGFVRGRGRRSGGDSGGDDASSIGIGGSGSAGLAVDGPPPPPKKAARAGPGGAGLQPPTDTLNHAGRMGTRNEVGALEAAPELSAGAARGKTSSAASAAVAVAVQRTRHLAPTSGASGSATARRPSSARGCPICLKKDEKISFYVRHSDELTADLQNKGRIIQTFLVREERGQIGPAADPARPKPKPKSLGLLNPLNRVATALGVNKGKGAMTLELAMEINGKLQQVIEDTLLQNIHLRESLDLMSSQPARAGAKVGPRRPR